MENEIEIVIPCFNESGNLESLFRDCVAVFEQSSGAVKFVLVNNGSTDDSEAIFSKLESISKGVKVVKVSHNRGYGAGILHGLRETSANYVGWTHADLQTPLTDLLKVQKMICSTEMFFKGKRVGRPVTDKIFTFGMSIFESALFHKKLYDINAQPNVFPKKFMDGWKNPPLDFSLDLFALVSAHEDKLPIRRFQVRFKPRISGQSNWNQGLNSKLKFIKRTLSYSFRLKGELHVSHPTSSE